MSLILMAKSSPDRRRQWKPTNVRAAASGRSASRKLPAMAVAANARNGRRPGHGLRPRPSAQQPPGPPEGAQQGRPEQLRSCQEVLHATHRVAFLVRFLNEAAEERGRRAEREGRLTHSDPSQPPANGLGVARARGGAHDHVPERFLAFGPPGLPVEQYAHGPSISMGCRRDCPPTCRSR